MSGYVCSVCCVLSRKMLVYHIASPFLDFLSPLLWFRFYNISFHLEPERNSVILRHTHQTGRLYPNSSSGPLGRECPQNRLGHVLLDPASWGPQRLSCWSEPAPRPLLPNAWLVGFAPPSQPSEMVFSWLIHFRPFSLYTTLLDLPFFHTSVGRLVGFQDS